MSSRFQSATPRETELARLIVQFLNAREASDASELADFERVLLVEEVDSFMEAFLELSLPGTRRSARATERSALLTRLRGEWSYDEGFFESSLNDFGRLRRIDELKEDVRHPHRRALQLLRDGHDERALRAMLNIVGSAADTTRERPLDRDLWFLRIADLLDHAAQFDVAAIRLLGAAVDMCDERMVEDLLRCARTSRFDGAPISEPT